MALLESYQLTMDASKRISGCCAVLACLPVLTGLARADDRPNVLLIIADDASRESFGAYGSPDVSTPGFDRIARSGALFKNAYNCNPKCAPARASLLTGRYSWQLEESCNHGGFMSDKWEFYPYMLEGQGYEIGYTGKGWGPGFWHGYNASRSPGRDNPAGHAFNSRKQKPPFKGISDIDYASNFEDFVATADSDKPFCFWMGVKEPHRGYGLNNWKLDGRDLSKVKVPAYLPDTPTIRGDLADYAIEVEWFDAHITRVLNHLAKIGELENTLVIATSDHGMPFPRVKGQIYDDGFHVPLAIQWPSKIKPGRSVDDFVTFPDFASTIVQAAGNEHPQNVSAQITGQSFLPQLLSADSGQIDPSRDHALLGKERHDIGRTDGPLRSVGYPVRAIRTKQYLYVHNFLPHRWPVGNPELGLRNCDGSPSKAYLTDLLPGSPEYKYYEMSFGKRPAEELFDVLADPDCINNLAQSPMHAQVVKALWKQLSAELTEQGDPRILGKGDIFDFYPNANIEPQRKVYKDPSFDPVEIFERWQVDQSEK